MKLRAAIVFGLAFACVALTSACSFSDSVDHCENDSQCGTGRCYEGFCIPARDDTSNTSAQTMGDGQTSSGGSGGTVSSSSSSNNGAGGKAGPSAPGSQNQPKGGSSSPGTTGGSGASGDKVDTTPPASGAEGMPCKDGAEMDCLADVSNKQLAETCNRGTQVCAGGVWGHCDGKPVPEAESCNMLDDNCDGEVDNVLERCYIDGQAGCSQAADGSWTCAGSCGTGTRTCRDGQLTACEGATTPAMEVCTPQSEVARNEDCDDQTDEGCECQAGQPRICYSGRAGTMGVGKCVGGTQTCTNGAYGPCTGEVNEQPETCSNMNADDDCNGVVDDVPTLNSKCVNGDVSGPCANGTLRCMGAALSCQSTAMPTTEVCNGRDDDCNGRTDDTFNLQIDPQNCGACGNRCASGEACCAGACANTQNNANNCGTCGAKCPNGQRCASGACMPTTMPMAGMPAGGSGPVGGTPGTGGAGATGGSGGPGPVAGCNPACAAGQTCCGSTCVDLMSNVMQCGTCGNACSGANAGCCGGRCTDLTQDENCGQCNKNCALLHVMNGTETVLCECAQAGASYDCQGRVLGLGLCLL